MVRAPSVLVTNNTAEFQRVAGLRLENWTNPPIAIPLSQRGLSVIAW
jgi:hypothetical protein